jgi:hypothetical protein
MKGSKARKNRKARQQVGNELIVSIPKEIVTLQWSPTLRFKWRPAGDPPFVLNTVFNTVNLLNTILCAKTSTTFNALFAFVKLRYLKLRVNAYLAGANATPSFLTLSVQDTAAAFAGSGAVYEVAPQGAEVATIEFRPKAVQKWGQWNSIADSCSFTLTGQDVDLTIEMGLSLRSQMGSSFTAINTGVAALPGAIYFRGLDSLSDSATAFPAVAEIGTTI